jgi:hypothetical protein
MSQRTTTIVLIVNGIIAIGAVVLLAILETAPLPVIPTGKAPVCGCCRCATKIEKCPCVEHGADQCTCCGCKAERLPVPKEERE